MSDDDKRIKITFEIPAWLLKRSTQNSRTQEVLRDEIGREAVQRGMKATRK